MNHVQYFLKAYVHEIFFLFMPFFVFWFSPSYLLDDQNTKHIKNSIKVQINRNTPPFIALEDEMINPSFEVQKIPSHSAPVTPIAPVAPKPLSVLRLASQKLDFPEHILHIQKPLLINLQESKENSLQSKPLRTLYLKGINLSYSSEERPIYQKIQKNIVALNKAQSLPSTNISTKPLSNFEKRWFAYTQAIDTTSSEEALASHVDTSINHQRNLLNDQNTQVAMPPQKWVGNVWVGLPDQKPIPQPSPSLISQNTRINPLNQDQDTKQLNNDNFQNKTSKNLTAMASMTTMAGMTTMATSLDSAPDAFISSTPIKVSGHITLSNGLGLLEDDDLNVAYVKGCSIVQTADIDLGKGHFTIDIEDPSFGLLLAQLRSRDGILRGSSQVLLRDFFKKNAKEDLPSQLEDTTQINLEVEPSNQVPAIRVVSIDGQGNNIPDTSILAEIENIGKITKLDKNGLFSIPEIFSDSSFITRMYTQGLWNALVWSTNDQAQDWQIPNKKLLISLQDSIPNLSLDLGMIWGRVIKDGQGLEGVSLELADVGDIYYLTENGQFVKDRATTNAGYFVYVNVPPGIHLLRGQGAGYFIPSKVLWVDRAYISSIQMEITPKQEADACVFDSQTGDFLAAQVNYLGSEDTKSVITSSGHFKLNFFQNADPLYFELKPDDLKKYHQMILTSHRNKKAISFPVIQRSWLHQIKAQHKMTQNPNLSTIVGYIANSLPFRVYMEDVNTSTEIIYFNAFESSYDESSLNMPADGFILFNVDPGLNSLILEAQSLQGEPQKRVAVKTLISDPQWISVFSHQF